MRVNTWERGFIPLSHLDRLWIRDPCLSGPRVPGTGGGKRSPRGYSWAPRMLPGAEPSDSGSPRAVAFRVRSLLSSVASRISSSRVFPVARFSKTRLTAPKDAQESSNVRYPPNPASASECLAGQAPGQQTLGHTLVSQPRPYLSHSPPHTHCLHLDST